MNAIQIAGLITLIGGIILQPIGWLYSHWVTPISFVASIIGVILLFHGRKQAGAGSGKTSEGAHGRDMPGDIYGHSGQMSGGRSKSWESHHSSNSSSSSE